MCNKNHRKRDVWDQSISAQSSTRAEYNKFHTSLVYMIQLFHIPQAYLARYSPTKLLSVSDLNIDRSSNYLMTKGCTTHKYHSSTWSIDRLPSNAQAVAYRRGKATYCQCCYTVSLPWYVCRFLRWLQDWSTDDNTQPIALKHFCLFYCYPSCHTLHCYSFTGPHKSRRGTSHFFDPWQ